MGVGIISSILLLSAVLQYITYTHNSVMNVGVSVDQTLECGNDESYFCHLKPRHYDEQIRLRCPKFPSLKTKYYIDREKVYVRTSGKRKEEF